MHIISYKKIRIFSKKHNQSALPLDTWYRIVKAEMFKDFSDIKNFFPSADLVGKLIVFNIGGNNFRLIAAVNFQTKRIFIRNILTHKEYDSNKWKADPWMLH